MFVDAPDARLVLWAATIGLTIVGTVVQVLRNDPTLEAAFRVTKSIAERFGLFTIIVLGEVVVGVADGLAEADRDAPSIATGIAALTIGFGIWWNYFDFVGRRQPRPNARNRGIWNSAHLPMWLGIAGAGAGMVSLIEHATDSLTPANTAWLLAGCTALMAAANHECLEVVKETQSYQGLDSCQEGSGNPGIAARPEGPETRAVPPDGPRGPVPASGPRRRG